MAISDSALNTHFKAFVEEMQVLFDAGEYKEMCDKFCPKHFGIMNTHVAEGRWMVTLGICSHAITIPWSEVPVAVKESLGIKWLPGAALRLTEHFDKWTPELKERIKSIPENILIQVKNGFYGC